MRHLKFFRISLLAGSVALALGFVGCAPYQQRPAAYPASPYSGGAYPAQAPMGIEYGRVSDIGVLQGTHRGQATGAGALIGAVVGGVLGNQVGRGSGRAAATAVGVVGGALAGNALEERGGAGGSDAARYRITIHLDRGGQRVYDVLSVQDLRVGDRVRLYNHQISRY